jgi:Cu+-exporting ATPase
MHFQQSPENKLQFIQKLQAEGKTVLMLGDGLNDAGALQQSDAGIAVSDNLNNFSPACDAILDGKILPRLTSLLNYCKSGKNVVAVSFAISLLYNCVGLWFAVRGELQPVIAAILMPVTSISIVSIATLSSTLIAKKQRL